MNKLKNLKSFIEENKDEIIKKLKIASKLETYIHIIIKNNNE